jgi:hypothetical protein
MSIGALRNSYQAFRSDLGQANLKGTFGLARGLKKFFAERVTPEQATEELQRALAGREESFLELARTQIYAHPGSSYRRLLELAGCEFSDLRAHIHRHGLETTLERLAAEGVYLTADEFKGNKEVVRGGRSFLVFPQEFARSTSSPGFAAQNSGSRSRPVHFVFSLDFLTASAPMRCVFFSAHDLFSYSHAVYDAVLPADGGMNNLLINAKLGISTERWFARKIPVNNRLVGSYHYLLTYLIVLSGKLFARGFPKPGFLDLRDISRIVRWVLDKRREGRDCCIRTVASNASRIAYVAGEMGVSLEGTKFIVSGEPFTESKREVIERVGASAIPIYGSAEAGGVGYGCASSRHTDEVHVDQYRLAVIQHPGFPAHDAPTIHPLLCTTVHPVYRHLLLNVGIGDYGTLEKRDCGCALEKVGLTLHLHHIRSYEKFASEGMNYFYGDLFELLERLLPAEFGGGPGDYQLVEDEDDRGQTRLSLLVHPEVGELDEGKLLSRLRAALTEGSRSNRFMTEVWQNAGTLRIRRQPPSVSPRGKILPLQMKSK